MAFVNLTNVTVLNNPCLFSAPFQFEITFECLCPLQEDLEWRVVYVGSAEDQSRDQTLEEVLVGPVPVGQSRFVLQAPAPNPQLIPSVRDLLGVTVVLVTCSYRGQEFVRVGYYVGNKLMGPPAAEDGGEEGGQQQEQQQQQPQLEEKEVPPEGTQIDIASVYRNVLADEPRVTRFDIVWEGDVSQPAAVAAAAAAAAGAGAGDEQLVDDEGEAAEVEGEDEEDDEEDEEGGDDAEEIMLQEEHMVMPTDGRVFPGVPLGRDDEDSMDVDVMQTL